MTLCISLWGKGCWSQVHVFACCKTCKSLTIVVRCPVVSYAVQLSSDRRHPLQSTAHWNVIQLSSVRLPVWYHKFVHVYNGMILSSVCLYLMLRCMHSYSSSCDISIWLVTRPVNRCELQKVPYFSKCHTALFATSRLPTSTYCVLSIAKVTLCIWSQVRFCMGAKLGRWHWGRNIGWGCWGEYLGLRGTGYPESGENYIMRNLMICTPHPILCGW